jgi:hypothetical protein
MRNRISMTLLAALLFLALGTLVRADSPPVALRSALTGGGGTLSAGGYRLTGALGQPLAGPVVTQGQYAFTSGLFGGAAGANGREVYLSLIKR